MRVAWALSTLLAVTLIGCGSPVPSAPAASTSVPSGSPSPAASPGHSLTPSPSSADPDPRLGPAIATEPYDGPFAPHAIAFTDSTSGFIAGDSGATYRAVVGTTRDGGRTWRLLAMDRPGLLDVAAAAGHVWVVVSCGPDDPPDCTPSLLRSDDGAKTWHALPGVSYVAPAFRDADHGWAIDQSTLATTGRATIVASDDGGLRWRPLAAPCPAGPEAPADVGVFAGGKGWVVCAGDAGAGSQGKAILGTMDDGATWQVLSFVGFEGGQTGRLPLGGIIQAAGIVPGAAGVLGTSHGTFRTADGGRTWREVSFDDPETHAVDAVSLVDHRSGYLLMRDFEAAMENLLTTNDGGVTWRRIASWAFPA
jgi:photosystem II stability/assembly factor-like uncharacterized protein